MKQLWDFLLPFATDSTGVCSLFCDSDSLVIGHDPGATALRCYAFTEEREDQRAHYAGMPMGETDMVLEHSEKRLEEYLQKVKETQPKQVVLVGSPVSSMLHVDLKEAARALEAETGLPVLYIPTTGNRYYDHGLSDAFRMLYEHLISDASGRRNPAAGQADARTGGQAALRQDPAPSPEETMETVNLLGFQTLDFPDPGERDLLLRRLERSGYRIGSIWGMHCVPENLERTREADWNLVCSISGLALAERMKETCGIPYRFLWECGILTDADQGTGSGYDPEKHAMKAEAACAAPEPDRCSDPGQTPGDPKDVPEGSGTLTVRPDTDGKAAPGQASEDTGTAASGADSFCDWNAEAQTGKEEYRILIVGEQITSCTLRHFLEGKVQDPQVRIDIAGFFRMDPGLKRASDIALHNEEDLQHLFSERKYDLLIGDPVLQLLPGCPESRFPLRHPPLSGRYEQMFESRSWGSAAAEEVCERILAERGRNL